MDTMNMDETKKGYGGRSIWQWIGIYFIIAVIVYGAAFFIYREVKDHGADDNGTTTTQSTGLY